MELYTHASELSAYSSRCNLVVSHVADQKTLHSEP